MMGCRPLRSRAILALNLNQWLTRTISALHKMYELQTWLIAIALIFVIAMGARGVVSWHRYWRHRRNVRTLPDPGALEGVQSGPLDEQGALLATELLNGASNLPTHEMEVTHHALWMAMLLEATSDGTLDRREIEIVTDLFGQMTGKKLDYRPFVEVAELLQSDPRSALAEISKARDFSEASKEHILAGAFLVSVADRKLAAGEANCLGDIADALAINPRDRKAIYEGITKRLSA
jgi:hypothetical protein